VTSPADLKWCPHPEHEGPNPLPLTEFCKDSQKQDGLASWCDTCRRRVQARWRKANPEKIRAKDRRRIQALQDTVFQHYGRICACPGCEVAEDLTIDHVNGDGKSHRENLFGGRYGTSEEFYRWLIETGFPPGIQVLCKPCNSSKGDGPACQIDHAGTGLKYCTHPGHEGPNPLPLSEFSKDRSRRDGLTYICRACESRRHRTWYANRNQDQENPS
jgi:hypothetical protein